MNESLTVVVAAPNMDAAVGAALAGRAASGRVEALIFDSEDLVEFFDHETQQELPRGYELVLCGVKVIRMNWDGRLVRPRLMKRLRGHVGLVRWFSASGWRPEDRRAVEHIIGEDKLFVDEGARSVAATVWDECCGRPDDYGRSLVQFARGELDDEEEEAWGADLRKVLGALKGDRAAMSEAVSAMMRQRIQDVIDQRLEQAERIEEENRACARENAEDPRLMRGKKLVAISIPRERHPFWAEISAYAREATGSELSMCHLSGRPTFLLSRGPELRIDLRKWARYLTDSLPRARAADARADAVPIVMEGSVDDAGLKEEILEALAEGAHLLVD